MAKTHRKGITGREMYWYYFTTDKDSSFIKNEIKLFENKQTEIVFAKKYL